MTDFILKLLAKESPDQEYAKECPTTRHLLSIDRVPKGDGLNAMTLAWHLLCCAVCSNRWELIQSDEHVDMAELYAVEHLDVEQFARLRALDHVQRCYDCQSKKRTIESMVVAGDPGSVHLSNFGALLRQEPATVVTRGAEMSRPLRAVVVNAMGAPYLIRNQVERVEMALHKALLSEDGRLEFEIQAVPVCSYIQVAVSSQQNLVMLPRQIPEGHSVRFVAHTRVRGEGRLLSPSSVAVWVARK